MTTISGITKASVDSVPFTVVEANYNAQTKKKDWIENNTGADFFSAKYQPAKVTLKIVTDPSFEVGNFFDDLESVTVSLTRITGAQILFPRATVTEIGDADTQAGTVDVTFMTCNYLETPAS